MELDDLIDIPTQARRLYPRGGFEGLEPNALQVLIALCVEPHRTVSDLVGELALGQGTVSTAIAVLQERELVATRPNPKDRRGRHLRPTRNGRALVTRFSGRATSPQRNGR